MCQRAMHAKHLANFFRVTESEVGPKLWEPANSTGVFGPASCSVVGKKLSRDRNMMQKDQKNKSGCSVEINGVAVNIVFCTLRSKVP